MKQIITACLLLASVMVTGCNGSTTTGGAAQGAPAAAPEARGGAAAASSGGTYKGQVKRGYEITFVMSPDGSQVSKVAANVLESCTGSSTSRTTQLYWDGPFAVGADGVVTAEGQDPEFKELRYRFTAKFAADGTATGTVLQEGTGCTTYELEWTARKE